LDQVITAILGGGQGTRLWPLTQYRAKPAVPVAGKFRLIDIPISNSLHAGIDKIFVLTQFNSASLHRHIAQTYRFDNFSQGFVNILAASQSIDTGSSWYQGTADAVRHNLGRLTFLRQREVLVLSGDQLYLLNMREFVTHHRQHQADLTIAVKPVPRSEAKSLGIMRSDAEGRIVEFVEKPQEEGELDRLALDAATIDRLGIEAEPGMLLASMGMYVFRREALQEVFKQDTSSTDFGKEIIPAAIHNLRVYGFLYNGYWRDIGTIPAFHEANLELTFPKPPLNLYHPDFPIYTHPRFLPGVKVRGCHIEDSVLCEGSVLLAKSVERSVIGTRSMIRQGTEIVESVIMGTGSGQRTGDGLSPVPFGIGKDCRIRRAIIDSGARIGDGAQLVNEGGVEDADGENYCIRGGVIVVPSNAVIEPGTVV